MSRSSVQYSVGRSEPVGVGMPESLFHGSSIHSSTASKCRQPKYTCAYDMQYSNDDEERRRFVEHWFREHSPEGTVVQDGDKVKIHLRCSGFHLLSSVCDMVKGGVDDTLFALQGPTRRISHHESSIPFVEDVVRTINQRREGFQRITADDIFSFVVIMLRFRMWAPAACHRLKSTTSTNSSRLTAFLSHMNSVRTQSNGLSQNLSQTIREKAVDKFAHEVLKSLAARGEGEGEGESEPGHEEDQKLPIIGRNEFVNISLEACKEALVCFQWYVLTCVHMSITIKVSQKCTFSHALTKMFVQRSKSAKEWDVVLRVPDSGIFATQWTKLCRFEFDETDQSSMDWISGSVRTVFFPRRSACTLAWMSPGQCHVCGIVCLTIGMS